MSATPITKKEVHGSSSMHLNNPRGVYLVLQNYICGFLRLTLFWICSLCFSFPHMQSFNSQNAHVHPFFFLLEFPLTSLKKYSYGC